MLLQERGKKKTFQHTEKRINSPNIVKNLIKALLAMISACESLTISPRLLRSERPTHFVPVPSATTSNSEKKVKSKSERN